jgi:hypothetical protein
MFWARDSAKVEGHAEGICAKIEEEAKMRMTSVAILCSALVGLWVAAPALAQQKTEKECQAEWQANKAANQAAKITEKAYVDKCRTEGAAATPAAAKPAPAPATPPATPAAAPAKPAATPAAPPAAKPAPTAATAPAGANEFAAEALAKARCPTDTVVWANLKSKIYHFSGNKDYGTTKEGAYMCEKDALGQGVRAAKNEKHP